VFPSFLPSLLLLAFWQQNRHCLSKQQKNVFVKKNKQVECFFLNLGSSQPAIQGE